MDESEDACRQGFASSCSDGDDPDQLTITRIKLDLWESQDSDATVGDAAREYAVTNLQESAFAGAAVRKKSVVLIIPNPQEPSSSPVAELGPSSTCQKDMRKGQREVEGRACRNRPWREMPRTVFEYGCIISALTITVLLFSLPIGFHYYHDLHTDYHEPNTSTNSSIDCSSLSWGVVYPNGSTGGCSAEPYTGSVCSQQLMAWQECLSDKPGFAKCKGCSNQTLVEQDLQVILQGVLLITGCEEADVRTLLCQHAYTPCNVSGGETYPSLQEKCEHVQSTCEDWWNLTEQSPAGYLLPNCSNLPAGNITDFPADMLGSGSAEMHCHTGFGPVNSSLCQPLCSEWKQYSSLHTVMVLSFEAMSATIGLTTGIVSIVITLLFYRDSLTRFLFMLLMTIGYCIISTLIIISRLGSDSILCSDPSLTVSIEEPTTYCTITGVLTHFFIINTTLCWFMHVLVFFCKVMFPFRFKAIEASNRKKRLFYITLLFIVYLTPIPPILLALIVNDYKYTVTRYPPSICAPRNGDYMYYSTALPLNIVILVGCVLLMMTFYTVHKSFLQVRRLRWMAKKRQTIHTAETKLMLLSLAFIGFAVVSLVYSSIATADLDEAFHTLEDYLTCESQLAVANECDRSIFEQFNHPVLNVITVVLMGLIPAVNFLFLVNWRLMKSWVLEVCFKHKTYRYHRGTVFFKTPTISTFVRYSISQQPTFDQ